MKFSAHFDEDNFFFNYYLERHNGYAIKEEHIAFFGAHEHKGEWTMLNHRFYQNYQE